MLRTAQSSDAGFCLTTWVRLLHNIDSMYQPLRKLVFVLEYFKNLQEIRHPSELTQFIPT